MSNENSYYLVGEPQKPTIRELTGYKRKDLNVVVVGPLQSVNYATGGTGKRTLHSSGYQIRGVMSAHADNLLRGGSVKPLGMQVLVLLVPALGIVTLVPLKRWLYLKMEFRTVTDIAEWLPSNQTMLNVTRDANDTVITL